MQVDKVKEKLPKEFSYEVLKSSIISNEEFHCEVRVNIQNEADFSRWLKTFQTETNSAWNLRRSSQKSGFLLCRQYVCQHSSYRKKKDGSKNKNCLASLSVQVQRNSKLIRYRDSFVKEGFFTTIKINFHHSHKINVVEAYNWLPRSEETKQIFIDYFTNGMSPVASKKYHESLLLSRSPELLSNSRINPPIRWIYDIHQKWFADNPGDLNNCGPDFDRCSEFYLNTLSDMNNEATDSSSLKEKDDDHPIFLEEPKNSFDIIMEEEKQREIAAILNFLKDKEEHYTAINELDDLFSYPNQNTCDTSPTTRFLEEEEQYCAMINELNDCFRIIADKAKNSCNVSLALREFLNTFIKLKTESALVSALNNFGKMGELMGTSKKPLVSSDKIAWDQEKTLFNGNLVVQSDRPKKRKCTAKQRVPKSVLIPEKEIKRVAPYFVRLKKITS